MILRNVLAVAGIAAVMAGSAVAINAYYDDYDDVDAPPRLSVSVRGLDLTSPEGIEQLDTRVRTAASRICYKRADHSLTTKRIEDECFDRAMASAASQVDRAIARARYDMRYQGRDRDDVERTIFTDLARQPGSIRRSMTRGVVRALVTGVTANWYTWGAKGFVFASDRYRDDRGRSCGYLTVTSKSHGVQNIVTDGRACVYPDEQFASAD